MVIKDGGRQIIALDIWVVYLAFRCFFFGNEIYVSNVVISSDSYNIDDTIITLAPPENFVVTGRFSALTGVPDGRQTPLATSFTKR